MLVDEMSLPAPVSRKAERAAVYRLFSSLFARELRAETITELARAAAGAAAPLAEDAALRPLFDHFKAMAEDPEAAERDLSGAFSFLFLGAGGPQSAPPYESVFTSESGRTCQEATALMARELASLDLRVEGEFREPADHIAIEMAVAATLIESDCSLERQTRFLKDRLHSWLPDFAAACARGDRTGFYVAAAKAAASFVSDDLDRLLSGPVHEV